MEPELTQLENQLEQLITLYKTGKTDARELRMRVARLEAENRELAEKVKFATVKLEGLLEKLPDA